MKNENIEEIRKIFIETLEKYEGEPILFDIPSEILQKLVFSVIANVRVIPKDIRPHLNKIDFSKEKRDLITSGILESFDIVQIITDLELLFNIKISGLEFTPENFASVNSIVKLVSSKMENWSLWNAV